MIRTNRLASSLLSFVITVVAGYAYAESPRTGYFNTDSVDAFGVMGNLQISVFARRSVSAFGTDAFAVVNMFDNSTGAFSQCVNAEFEISVNNARATLSLTTTEIAGFNCPSGQLISLACSPGSQSGVFHNVTNGTADLRVFDQRYTTHGLQDSFAGMDCVLTAFGGQVSLPRAGAALTERLHTTP